MSKVGKPAAPPPASEAVGPTVSVRWFYKTAAGKTGPVGTDELRDLIGGGRLPPETPLWREGMPAWTPADEIPELADAVSAARSSSAFRPGPGRPRLGLPLMVGLCALLAPAWYGLSWILAAGQTARVTGVVSVGAEPVTGGSVVLAPVRESKSDLPGKPAVATVGTDGSYALQLAPGRKGLARLFWVRFSPPPLPVMTEAEAMKAVPPYLGLVPKTGQVEIVAGANRINVELVPATPK
jgi:hypothetical protein